MTSNFIPNFHYDSPESKLTPEWAMKVVDYYYHNMANKNLLDGKNVDEIEQYFTGNIDMKPFMKIFKSLRKSLVKQMNPNLPGNNYQSPLGLEPEALALMPEKFNSAIAIVSKVPVEISCNANDPYALEKKQRDINFIKNKPLVEAMIQQVYDKVGLGEVDLGTTENSAVPFSDSPFGFDLNNPDELDIFVNLIYSLKVESALETGLQAFWEILKLHQIRLLEIRDQFKFGVSVNRGTQHPITFLPFGEYIYPGDIEVPNSMLNDYNDRTHTIFNKDVTPLDLFNAFPDEIPDKATLNDIINKDKTGYCDCNKISNKPHPSTFGSFKIQLKYFEVKSVDYIGVAESKHKKGYTSFTQDGKTSKKLWAQNLYGFWWLVGTEHVFKIQRFGFAHRERGKESYQNSTFNINRSQKKSPCELAIPENKKAIIADIKLLHALVKSLPAGRYFDLRYMRSALSALTEDNNSKTIDDMINLLLEHNTMIGDTEGFEGRNDGQFKPVIELAGGLKTEVAGYIDIIRVANDNISRITGINPQLTGQSANPEGLVGLQKLLINSSINALNYCNDAITDQNQKLISLVANIIHQCIEEGGEAKKAIIALIGSRKANVIDSLDDIRLHDIGVKVRISQREEERSRIEQSIMEMKQKGILGASDDFMVQNIDNPKDKWAFLAVKEQKWKKEQQQIAQQRFQEQQALTQQMGQNQIATKQAESEGRIKEVYAKGDVQSKILTLAGELGLNAQNFKAMVDTNLQRERNKSQADKNIEILHAKSNIEKQNSLV